MKDVIIIRIIKIIKIEITRKIMMVSPGEITLKEDQINLKNPSDHLFKINNCSYSDRHPALITLKL